MAHEFEGPAMRQKPPIIELVLIAIAIGLVVAVWVLGVGLPPGIPIPFGGDQ